MKICSVCKCEKLFDSFYEKSGSKDGYHSYCKDCHKSYRQKRHETKKGIDALRARQYYLDNKEALDKKSKDYYEQNREQVLQRCSQYYQENKVRVCQRTKKYYIANRSKCLDRSKFYQVANQDKIKSYMRVYNALHWRNNRDVFVLKFGMDKWDLYKWSSQVKERDGFRCSICGSEKKLHAHHILSKSKHPELILVLNNGVTLCSICHNEEHRLNGYL